MTATWTSGVEPCNVLDTVIVKTGDHAFTITLREGHGAGQVACIEIAQIKRTRIDLGELEPGHLHDLRQRGRRRPDRGRRRLTPPVAPGGATAPGDLCDDRR